MSLYTENQYKRILQDLEDCMRDGKVPNEILTNRAYLALGFLTHEKFGSTELPIMKTKPLDVSDHAILRVLERGADVQVDKLKDNIAKKVKPYSDQLGDGKYCIDGLTYVVKDSVVVTIYQ